MSLFLLRLIPRVRLGSPTCFTMMNSLKHNRARGGIACLNGSTRQAISEIVSHHSSRASRLSVCKDMVRRIRERHAHKAEVSRPERGLIHSAMRHAVSVHVSNICELVG